jgi:hypothetical protein
MRAAPAATVVAVPGRACFHLAATASRGRFACCPAIWLRLCGSPATARGSTCRHLLPPAPAIPPQIIDETWAAIRDAAARDNAKWARGDGTRGYAQLTTEFIPIRRGGTGGALDFVWACHIKAFWRGGAACAPRSQAAAAAS